MEIFAIITIPYVTVLLIIFDAADGTADITGNGNTARLARHRCRSSAAAQMLIEAGYAQVYTISRTE